MRILNLIAAIVLALSVAAEAARCTGSPSCTACKSCSSCGHCKAGGSCGVCSPSKPASPTPAPAPRQIAPAQARPPRPAPAKIPAAANAPAIGKARVYFSPGGGGTAAIVGEIEKAQSSVKVQAYRLTSPPIVKALVAAKERGVSVEVVLDKRQQSDRYSDATYLANHQIPVLIDHDHAIAHDKVILIDSRVVITGSFNFSQAAESANSENLLILEECPDVAQAYQGNYDKHVQHAEAYARPRLPADSTTPAAPTIDQEAEQSRGFDVSVTRGRGL